MKIFKFRCKVDNEVLYARAEDEQAAWNIFTVAIGDLPEKERAALVEVTTVDALPTDEEVELLNDVVSEVTRLFGDKCRAKDAIAFDPSEDDDILVPEKPPTIH